MTEKEEKKGKDPESSSLMQKFRTSDNKVISILREILWVIAVVGGIVLVLFLISGTWPAVVVIESESMVPHMNVGDLVFVVQADRFGPLQTWTEGKQTGYTKFGSYGDVIIYKPNGGTPSQLPVIGNIPFIGNMLAHPIIHRAMVWQGPGPIEIFVNPGGANKTPSEYIVIPPENITPQGVTIPYKGPDTGYIIASNRTSDHGGYITKGDNNQVSDEGSLLSHYTNLGPVEPVKPDWIVGKALFTIPVVGYLPLNIIPVAIIIIIVIVIHELYLDRKKKNEASAKKARKKRDNK